MLHRERKLATGTYVEQSGLGHTAGQRPQTSVGFDTKGIEGHLTSRKGGPRSIGSHGEVPGRWRYGNGLGRVVLEVEVDDRRIASKVEGRVPAAEGRSDRGQPAGALAVERGVDRGELRKAHVAGRVSGSSEVWLVTIQRPWGDTLTESKNIDDGAS